MLDELDARDTLTMAQAIGAALCPDPAPMCHLLAMCGHGHAAQELDLKAAQAAWERKARGASRG